jgi:hypothetical protein
VSYSSILPDRTSFATGQMLITFFFFNMSTYILINEEESELNNFICIYLGLLHCHLHIEHGYVVDVAVRHSVFYNSFSECLFWPKFKNFQCLHKPNKGFHPIRIRGHNQRPTSCSCMGKKTECPWGTNVQ